MNVGLRKLEGQIRTCVGTCHTRAKTCGETCGETPSPSGNLTVGEYFCPLEAGRALAIPTPSFSMLWGPPGIDVDDLLVGDGRYQMV